LLFFSLVCCLLAHARSRTAATATPAPSAAATAASIRETLVTTCRRTPLLRVTTRGAFLPAAAPPRA